MIPVAMAAVIPIGASQSQEMDLAGCSVFGLNLPASIDGATSITFLASDTQGSGWQKLADGAGAELTLTVAAATSVGLTQAQQAVLSAFRFVKLRLGTAATPVVATAIRTIPVVLKSQS